MSGSGFLLPDVSGYGNHGTLTNMASDDWVSAQYGRALDFDGTDDRVIVGYKPEFLLANLRTFTGWVNVRSFDGAFSFNDIISRDNTLSGGTRDWNIAVGDPNSNDTDGYIGFALWATGGGGLFCEMTTEKMVTNRWYHFACTYDGGTSASGMGIYLDGEQQAVSTSTQGTFTSPSTSTNELWIGRRPGITSDLHFNGQMDDLRLYSRILSPSQIRLLSSEPGIGLRQEQHRQTFYQFPSGSRRRLLLTGQT